MRPALAVLGARSDSSVSGLRGQMPPARQVQGAQNQDGNQMRLPEGPLPAVC